MKQGESIEPLFDAIETLCTVSANQPSLPESTSIVIDSEMVDQSKAMQLLCIQCNREFKTASQLKHHLGSGHLNIRPFKCTLCNASFTQVAHLKAHRRIHSGERPFQCQQCDSAFVQLSHLKTHQKLHTGEKPFACDICDSRFRQQSNLKSHRLIHTGERPYKCDVCSSSFVQIGHLKSHKRIHTDERPYQCKDCSASFRQISNLRNHERTHQSRHLKGVNTYKIRNKTKRSRTSGIFVCSECDFSAHARDHVLSHFRSFHTEFLAKNKSQSDGDLIFMCSDCCACFNSCESIKAHMKSHAGCKLFACPTCDETFINSAELLRHRSQQHNDGRNSSIQLGTITYGDNKTDSVLEYHNDLSELESPSCQVLFVEEGEETFTHSDEKAIKAEMV